MIAVVKNMALLKMIYFQKKYLYMIYTIASMPIEVMSCYNNFVTMYD